LSLGDEPFVCGNGELCPSGYECLFGVCSRIGRPDATPADAGPRVIDASCSPNEFIGCLDGTHAEVCNGDGAGILEVQCPGGCDASAELCVRCQPNSVTCEGDVLTTCGPRGDVVDTEVCHAGCDATQPATCLVLVPKNLPDTLCEDAPLEELLIQQDRELDTGSCSAFGGELVGQASGDTICLLHLRALALEPGVRVKVTGPHPLAVVALESVNLFGTVDISADGMGAGAGAISVDGGEGGGDSSNGGGGGGYQTSGAGGGKGTTGEPDQPEGGSARGNESLTPLVGGAPGGGGGVPCTVGPCPAGPLEETGGGGGGALQIVACQELRIGQLARINAGGGGGPAGPPLGILGPAGGGSGGGSGGAILIEAPIVTLPNGSKVTATGGGGGGGGAAMEPGLPGEDANDELPGRAGAGASGAGAGGRGGIASNVPPMEGGDARSDSGGGGGGGGGAAGRIRLEARLDQPIVIAPGARVVPPPAQGVIATRRRTP
jgi:hypothetical protein